MTEVFIGEQNEQLRKHLHILAFFNLVIKITINNITTNVAINAYKPNSDLNLSHEKETYYF